MSGRWLCSPPGRCPGGNWWTSCPPQPAARKKPSREADEVQPDRRRWSGSGRLCAREPSGPQTGWRGWDCSMTGSMPAQWPGITQKRATVRGRFRMSCTAGECPAFWGGGDGRRFQGANVLDELLIRRLRGAEPTQENLKRACDYLARPGLFLGGDRPGGGAVPPSGRGIAAFQHLSSAEPG